MTQRRRLSRAQVERTVRRANVPIVDDPLPVPSSPVDRKAVDAWWGATLPALPPAQDAAQFRREDVTGTFANRAQGSVLSVEALREMQRVLTERSVAMPRPMVMPRWLERESARFASDPYYPDGLWLAWGIDWSADVVRERERRAVERTGRVLVAWLIGRWRR